MIMTLVSVCVFAGTLAVSIYAIAATVAPRFDRIASALRGDSPAHNEPLAVLVKAERRIAVKRWAAQPQLRPAPLRAAA